MFVLATRDPGSETRWSVSDKPFNITKLTMYIYYNRYN